VFGLVLLVYVFVVGCSLLFYGIAISSPAWNTVPEPPADML
jgi:hypothetical protein